MVRVRLQAAPALSLLDGIAQKLTRVEELLAPAVPLVAAAIERNFEEEGRPVRWTPLSPRYAAYKARRYAAGLRILERSGRLRRSITTRLGAGALVTSTDAPHAVLHQSGTRRLPARPFLVVTESDKEAVAQAVADSLGTPYSVPGTSP
jgi:phage gpG-like protein